jgi:hypothetical protein
MAYTAGDSILDDEYNAFVGSSSDPYGYNHFAGTGSGVYGLNQSSIATVSAGGTITASSWNSLFTGLDNIANHTNVSITSSSVSAGDAIAVRAALISDLASLAAAVAAGSTSATAIATPTAAGSSSNSATWNSTSTIERSITFANSATMRAFFNAGGYIRIDPSCTTGIDGSKDDVFNDLTTTAIGNLDLKAHISTRSGSGETLTTNGLANGFHELSTGYTVLLKLTSDNSGYTSNTVEISAKLNAAPATATVLTIKMVSTDPADDTLYTAGNLDSVPANPNEAPRMVLALLEAYPTNAQGLAADIRAASNAEVSNAVTN